MKEFQLNGSAFIELNKVLKIASLVGSGGEANQYIVDGEVAVNGITETAKRKKIKSGDEVEFQGNKVKVV